MISDDRWVVYSSYDTDDEQTDRVPDYNPLLWNLAMHLLGL